MYPDQRTDALERGRAGERYLKEILETELSGRGLTVSMPTEEDHRVPFDLETLDGDRILVGIENKDLGPSSKGTWQYKTAIRRKLRYAHEHSIPKILTTVTMREAGRIGFCRGLANSHVIRFDFELSHLLQEIKEAST